MYKDINQNPHPPRPIIVPWFINKHAGIFSRAGDKKDNPTKRPKNFSTESRPRPPALAESLVL
jgi:hypothetical protein